LPDASPSGLSLSASNAPTFRDEVFHRAADMIRRAGGFTAQQMATPEARAVIAETAGVLNQAIGSSLSHEVPDALRYALENNAFIFSGFKAYHSLREVGLSLTDSKGNIKPFEEFTKDVQAISQAYNRNYLYAEYNHAVAASQMAEKWQRWEQDGDRYDLQYRTAQDDRVREAHALLHGTTLPPSDPFWEKYLPPNGWNCRCTTVQVRKGKYPQSDPVLAMQRGDNSTASLAQQIFRYNPGKTLDLFPPKHPYYKAPKAAKKVIQTVTKDIKSEQDAIDMLNASPTTKGWFERGFSQLIKTTQRGVNGYTDMNGLIAMTPQRMQLTLSGLDKIQKGKEITFDEADALATFWHEITHNRNKPGNMYSTRKQTQLMELANEFVARKTLPEFYQGLGGKMQFPEFMTNRDSTGYNTWVRNYDAVIKATGADPDKVLSEVRTHLFNERYDNQEEGLVAALEKGGAKKKNGKVLKRSELKKIVGYCLYGGATFQNGTNLLIMQ